MKHKNSKILTGSENFEGRRKKTFSVWCAGLTTNACATAKQKIDLTQPFYSCFRDLFLQTISSILSNTKRLQTGRLNSRSFMEVQEWSRISLITNYKSILRPRLGYGNIIDHHWNNFVFHQKLESFQCIRQHYTDYTTLYRALYSII